MHRQRTPIAAATLVIAAFVTTAVSSVPAQELDGAGQTGTARNAANLRRTPSTWKGAATDTLRLLAFEHTFRVAFQEKTRRELGGPFLTDYVRSLRIPKTWGDGDSRRVNYVAHPIHGAAAGFVWLDHEDGAHDPKLGFSRGTGPAAEGLWPGRPRSASSSSSVR